MCVLHQCHSTHLYNAGWLQGHIDEEDLVAYAQLQGLPSAYVKPFVAAVRNSRSAAGSSSGDEEEEGPDLTYARFKRFVEGREEGLRHAFGLFDRGGQHM